VKEAKEKTILYYQTADGKRPYGEWFLSIDTSHAERVDDALRRMERGNLGDCEPVGEGVSERRIFGDPAIRVYFGTDGNEIIVLLTGGYKGGQQADIAAAKEYWADYKARKKPKKEGKKVPRKARVVKFKKKKI